MTRAEVAATWLYSAEYAASGKSARDFYAALDKKRKNNIDMMLIELDAAKK